MRTRPTLLLLLLLLLHACSFDGGPGGAVDHPLRWHAPEGDGTAELAGDAAGPAAALDGAEVGLPDDWVTQADAGPAAADSAAPAPAEDAASAPDASDGGPAEPDAATASPTAEDFAGSWSARRLRLPCGTEVTAALFEGCEHCAGTITVSPTLEVLGDFSAAGNIWPLWRPAQLLGGRLYAVAADPGVDWSLHLWLDGDDILGAEKLVGPSQTTCFALWAVRP